MDSLLRPSNRTFYGTAQAWFLSGLPLATLAYFAVVAVSYALINAARLRARERDAAELSSQLTSAKLGALTMQLQPHFLFNSLNAIMALVRDQDTRGALRSLGLLGDVLRSTLALGSTQEVPLRTEMEMVERYLAMEQVRFGNRLAVQLAIPDELLDCAVPTFILQPLVENALRHGIAPVRAGGQLTIAAAHAAPDLRLTVEDTGRGLPAGSTGRHDEGVDSADGLGLANTRGRLTALYGASGRLTVSERPASAGGGVIATITIPYRLFQSARDSAATSRLSEPVGAGAS
jgi:LytS/YehU family sensor histidine kinase